MQMEHEKCPEITFRSKAQIEPIPDSNTEDYNQLQRETDTNRKFTEQIGQRR